MNEADILEMGNRLKEMFIEKEKENLEYIKKYNKLYKNLCVIYGLIRAYQENDNDIFFYHLIDEIRGICSENLFNHLKEEDDE